MLWWLYMYKYGKQNVKNNDFCTSMFKKWCFLFFLAKPLRIQNILSHKTFYGLGKTFFKIALLILSKCISGKNLCNKRKSSNGILEFFSKIMLMLLLVSQILDNVQSTIKKAKLLIVFGWRGENKDMSTFYLLWIYVRYKHLLIIKGRAHKTLSVVLKY